MSSSTSDVRQDLDSPPADQAGHAPGQNGLPLDYASRLERSAALRTAAPPPGPPPPPPAPGPTRPGPPPPAGGPRAGARGLPCSKPRHVLLVLFCILLP